MHLVHKLHLSDFNKVNIFRIVKVMYRSKKNGLPVNLPSRYQEQNALLLATVPIGTLLNLSMGTLTMYLKLPIFLDATGTLVTTILVGVPAGIATAISSSLLGGLLVNPVIPYYTGTQVALAIVTGWMAKKGFFCSMPKAIVTGLLLGITAAITSAPIVILFGGFTGTCTDMTTALLLANGQSFFQSVFWSNFANEPLDKVVQCLVVSWLSKSLPRTLKEHFVHSGYLSRNL